MYELIITVPGILTRFCFVHFSIYGVLMFSLFAAVVYVFMFGRNMRENYIIAFNSVFYIIILWIINVNYVNRVVGVC